MSRLVTTAGLFRLTRPWWVGGVSWHLYDGAHEWAIYGGDFDGPGSVVALVDASGVVQARYGYDPYGQTTLKQGPDTNPSATAVADGNPWRYTGAYLDATGLYKLGERYYDAAQGRFTQLDPLGNGYVYASDNPVNFVDPSGLCDSSGTDGQAADQCVGGGPEGGEGGGYESGEGSSGRAVSGPPDPPLSGDILFQGRNVYVTYDQADHMYLSR